MTEQSLPLTVRKEFRDQEPNKVKHLEKIKSLTGVEWTFEMQPAVNEFYPVIRKDLQDKFAKKTIDYIGAVATMFETKLADSMTKEAFLEAATGHKIILKLGDKDVDYHKCVAIDGGNLILITSKSDFGWSMSSYSGFALDTLL